MPSPSGTEPPSDLTAHLDRAALWTEAEARAVLARLEQPKESNFDLLARASAEVAAFGERNGLILLRVTALRLLAVVFYRQGRLDDAGGPAREALTLLGDEARAPREAALLHNLTGVIAMDRGSTAAARQHLGRALALFEEQRDELRCSRTLNNLGVVCAQEGRVKDAITHHLRALAIVRRLGHAGDQASTLHNLGVTLSQAGYAREARPFLEHGIALARRHERAHVALLGALSLAAACAEAGEGARARALIEEGIAHCEHEELYGELVDFLLLRAKLQHEAGDGYGASTDLLRARGLAATIDDRRLHLSMQQAWARFLVSAAARGVGRYDVVQARLQANQAAALLRIFCHAQHAREQRAVEAAIAAAEGRPVAAEPPLPPVPAAVTTLLQELRLTPPAAADEPPRTG